MLRLMTDSSSKTQDPPSGPAEGRQHPELTEDLPAPLRASLRDWLHVNELRLATQDMKIKELTLAVANGIEHVDRAERRIKSTVKRAEEELAALGYEHDGVAAEAAELREQHAGGSGEQEVSPVHHRVEDDHGDDDRFPADVDPVLAYIYQGLISR